MNKIDRATTRAFKPALVAPQAPQSIGYATDGGPERRAGYLPPRVSERTRDWIDCSHSRNNKFPIEKEHSRTSDGRWNYLINPKSRMLVFDPATSLDRLRFPDTVVTTPVLCTSCREVAMTQQHIFPQHNGVVLSVSGSIERLHRNQNKRYYDKALAHPSKNAIVLPRNQCLQTRHSGSTRIAPVELVTDHHDEESGLGVYTVGGTTTCRPDAPKPTVELSAVRQTTSRKHWRIPLPKRI